jgi:hypothetical protein
LSKLFFKTTLGAQATIHISKVAHHKVKSVALERFCNQKFQLICISEILFTIKASVFAYTPFTNGKTTFHAY